MILPPEFTPLAIVNLILASILFLGAVADVVIFTLLRDKHVNGSGSLRVIAVLILTLVGILSVIGSLVSGEVEDMLRYPLGILRGGGSVLVWTLVIHDLNKYMNERVNCREV